MSTPRGVAQLGSARGVGPRGRRFNSSHPDSATGSAVQRQGRCAMAIKSRGGDRETIRRGLRGELTEEKRRLVAMGVSDRVKRAVGEAIRRNKKALRELGDY